MPEIKTNSYHGYSNTGVLLICVIYFFCISLVAFYSYKKPEYNWDMLAYMALVVKMGDKNINEIHSITYESAKENIPAEAYQRLTDSSNAYRKKMKESPADFYQQLPFYIVKPLYVIFVYAFYKTGFSLPASTVLPSIVAYFLIGILLLYWLQKCLAVFYAATASLLVMLSPPVLAVARMSTPDCLSALLMFSAFYFIVEKPRFIAMFILLTASVFARVDNIIVFSAILFLLVFANKKEFRISAARYIFMLLLLIVFYFCITSTARNFGWNILYYPSFLHYLNLSRGFHTSFSVREYLKLIYSAVVTGLYHSYIAFFLLMVSLMFYKNGIIHFSRLGFEKLFSVTIVIVIAIRFVLHPDISDRFYIAYYLMIIILFVRMLTGNNNIYYQQKNIQ
jgi:hypothetical protein